MADNPDKSFEKKVDEDWKKRAREEAAEVSGKSSEDGGAAQAGPGPGGVDQAAADEVFEAMPPFLRLVSELALQASVHMGFVENPATGKKEKDLPAARHALDILGMLKDKTRGNLDEAESSYLEEVLYNLHMGYVRQAK
jgi:hypothetical protein